MAENSLQPLYDSKPSGYFEWNRAELLPFIPAAPRKVLDVGCGTGAFSTLVKQQHNAEVWGVELNPDAAATARERLDKVFQAMFSPELNLPAAYFDVICFNDVLEHMPDPGSALRYARSLLAPDGRVTASLPNFRHFPNIWKLIVHKSARYENEGIMDRTHLRIFTKSSIAALFQEGGLEIERIEGINGHLVTRWFRILNALSLGSISDMRWLQFAVVARSA